MATYLMRTKRARNVLSAAIGLAVAGIGASIARGDVSAFGGNGAGWTVNGTGSGSISSDVLTLTTGANGQTTSAFFNTQQAYTTLGWTASFTYSEPSGSAPPADGAAFVLQNDSRGATAVGGGGGSLGLGNSPYINPAGSFQINIFSGGGGVGVNYARNAAINNGTGQGYLATSPVNLVGNNPINVTINYDGGTSATETLVDPANSTTYTHTFAVHAADFGGSNYFVGFSGATGGLNSTQTISNFVFKNQGVAAPANLGVFHTGDVVTGSSSNFPGAENPGGAIDQAANTKYLNFDKLNTGFTDTPAVGATIVNDLELTSANDAPERDPASFIINGSNDGGLTFTQIATGIIPAFTGRFTEQDFPFANSTAYTTYQVVFPTVQNASAANSMQIADVQLYGTAVPEPASLGLIGLGALGLLARRRQA